MKEEILIISNYYPPEIGAASNRIEQLAILLKKNQYVVTVVCPLANYPKNRVFPEYRGKFFVKEFLQDISVRRLWIHPNNSQNVFKRTVSSLSFSMSLLLYLIFTKTPHKAVVQSPPLLISFVAVLILKLKGKKIVLNVSDLWPLAATELKIMRKNSISHTIFLFLEKFIYKNAHSVLGQSNEIISHIRALIPDKKCFLYRNFSEHKTTGFQFKNEQPIKLFYAGLIGMAQGVYELCQNINLQDLNLELHLYGEGSEKEQVEVFLRKSPNCKITYHGMFDRKELYKKLKKMDIAIVPLKTRIYGSVPSKIFEYAALGFPVFYLGGGEGEKIVENKLGWVSDAGDYGDLNVKLTVISGLKQSDLFERKKQVLEYAQKHFNLDEQLEQLIKEGVF